MLGVGQVRESGGCVRGRSVKERRGCVRSRSGKGGWGLC